MLQAEFANTSDWANKKTKQKQAALRETVYAINFRFNTQLEYDAKIN